MSTDFDPMAIDMTSSAGCCCATDGPDTWSEPEWSEPDWIEADWAEPDWIEPDWIEADGVEGVDVAHGEPTRPAWTVDAPAATLTSDVVSPFVSASASTVQPITFDMGTIGGNPTPSVVVSDAITFDMGTIGGSPFPTVDAAPSSLTGVIGQPNRTDPVHVLGTLAARSIDQGDVFGAVFVQRVIDGINLDTTLQTL